MHYHTGREAWYLLAAGFYSLNQIKSNQMSLSMNKFLRIKRVV